FAPGGGQFAARFAAEKVRDHRSGAARDRGVRPRTFVTFSSIAARERPKAAGTKKDGSGVRAFFLSMAALAVALFLALYSGAAAEMGSERLAGISALASLAVAGWVAITLVPILARRTPLRWINFKIQFKMTREG